MIPDRLPKAPAKALLISGQYPKLSNALARLGITAIATQEENRLPSTVRWHPDMQVCVLAGRTFVLKGSSLLVRLAACGIQVEETFADPQAAYPGDVLCNVLSWGRWAMGNLKTVDRRVLQAAEEAGLEWIPVKQGYAACSTALVDENATITADPGVAQTLERSGVEVLRIRPGFVELPGYANGLFGGCCGKISLHKMAFAGRLDSHPDGQEIAAFLASHQVQPVELLDGPLLDVGGILPFL